MSEYCRKVYGTNEELIALGNDIFASGTDTYTLTMKNGGKMDSRIAAAVKDPAKDLFYAVNLEGYENNPLSVMDPYVKYIRHVHFKL